MTTDELHTYLIIIFLLRKNESQNELLLELLNVLSNSLFDCFIVTHFVKCNILQIEYFIIKFHKKTKIWDLCCRELFRREKGICWNIRTSGMNVSVSFPKTWCCGLSRSQSTYSKYVLMNHFRYRSLSHIKPEQTFFVFLYIPHWHLAMHWWFAPEGRTPLICEGSTCVTHWQRNDVTSVLPCCCLQPVVCFSDTLAKSEAHFLEGLDLLVKTNKGDPTPDCEDVNQPKLWKPPRMVENTGVKCFHFYTITFVSRL